MESSRIAKRKLSGLVEENTNKLSNTALLDNSSDGLDVPKLNLNDTGSTTNSDNSDSSGFVASVKGFIKFTINYSIFSVNFFKRS